MHSAEPNKHDDRTKGTGEGAPNPARKKEEFRENQRDDRIVFPFETVRPEAPTVENHRSASCGRQRKTMSSPLIFTGTFLLTAYLKER
jgi:hypothetical protein